MMSKQDNKAGILLEEMSQRILSGNVVFFIGSGFSIDSEGNTSRRLISRLVIRFLSLCQAVCERAETLDRLAPADSMELPARKTINMLCKTFIEIFNIKTNTAGPADGDYLEHLKSFLLDENRYGDAIGSIVNRYYEFNDWICSAYDELLDTFMYIEEERFFIRADVIDRVFAIERESISQHSFLKEDGQDMQIPDHALLGNLHPPARGKVLFFETMGFSNPVVMAGDPDALDIQKVIDSYTAQGRKGSGDGGKSRLLPRHMVLARLAREGLCPTLVTTNYDQLLEGGLRLAGFTPRPHTVLSENMPTTPAMTRWPCYERITHARQYYYRPDKMTPHWQGRQRVHLVKIHGCVNSYRQACKDVGRPGGLQDILPSMVFTFREIQNWRQDAWSRDMLASLLRTKTMIFCGYSLQDQVLHDTFRTVYEEMASRCPLNHCRRPQEENLKQAPAFFMGEKKAQFHALEVLRAASQAVGGGRAPLTWHPNLLQLSFKNDEGAFPDTDDALLILLHHVCRQRQIQILERELMNILSLLGCQQRTPGNVNEFIRRFAGQYDEEKEKLRMLLNVDKAGDKQRREVHGIIDWTVCFHPGLLRDMAEASEKSKKNTGTDSASAPWYYPLGESYAWTAWAVVLEMVLRKIMKKATPPSTLPMFGIDNSMKSLWLQGRGQSPGREILLFVAGSLAPPVGLTIAWQSLDEIEPRFDDARYQHIMWSLPDGAIPWCSRTDRTKTHSGKTEAPDAGELWHYLVDDRPETPDPCWLKPFLRSEEETPENETKASSPSGEGAKQ